MDPNNPSPEDDKPETPLDALNAGLAAADALEPPAPEPVAEEVVPDPVVTEEFPDPAVVTEEVVTEEVVAEETPEQAEAKLAQADAEEARGLGFKNEKGVAAYQKVKKEARTATEQAEAFKAQVEEWKPQAEAFQNFRSHMQQIGMTPEQFGTATALVEAFNSNDPAKLAACEAELENQLAQIRQKLGVTGDILAAHPDLLQAVEDGTDRKLAEEIARNRTLASKTNEFQQHRQTQEETSKADFESAVRSAVSDLDALGVELQTDPHYQHKVGIAMPAFLKVRDSLHPSKWEAAFLREFHKVQPPKPKPAVTTVPVRATGSPAGLQRVASTPIEALEMGMAAADKGVTW